MAKTKRIDIDVRAKLYLNISATTKREVVKAMTLLSQLGFSPDDFVVVGQVAPGGRKQRRTRA